MAFRKFARSHVGIINKYGCSVRKHIEEGICLQATDTCVCVRVRVCSFSLDSESLCAHFLSAHTDFNIYVDVVVDACVYCSDSLFMYGKYLYHCYKSIWNH